LGHSGFLARLKLGISIWITAIMLECSCKLHAHKQTRALGFFPKPTFLEGLAITAAAMENQMSAYA
jgi:hypothetical protein